MRDMTRMLSGTTSRIAVGGFKNTFSNYCSLNFITRAPNIASEFPDERAILGSVDISLQIPLNVIGTDL
jgi:hypothetical protein